MKNNSNLRRFILLWAGELISSIGGGLMAVIAIAMLTVRSIRSLENEFTEAQAT